MSHDLKVVSLVGIRELHLLGVFSGISSDNLHFRLCFRAKAYSSYLSSHDLKVVVNIQSFLFDLKVVVNKLLLDI